MSIKNAYNNWADVYDDNINKTRDLEAVALHTTLQPLPFTTFLEIGCGTGKNTAWLVSKAKHVTAVDFSEAMVAKAKQKITGANVEFVQADINEPWCFTERTFDAAGCSLVLEHVQNLQHVFGGAAAKLNSNGYLYIGELHPFKQYSGSKARFAKDERLETVTCFTHHVSEFINTALANGFVVKTVNEYFDEELQSSQNIPRLLVMLFQKNS